LRFQLGIFMAWEWLGDNRKQWSAKADQTLLVLEPLPVRLT